MPNDKQAVTQSQLKKILANTGDMALKRRAMEILSGLEIHKGDKVLDVGCGDGYYLHLLDQLYKGVELVGTDYDQKGLDKAKVNLSRHINLFSGDLMKRLPFKTNYFNAASMSEVAEHLPDDLRGLREVARILKPGAILCLTVPNANYPLLWDPINWILERTLGTHIKSGFFAGLWNQHIRLYSADRIAATVEKAGFKVEKVKQLTWWCLPFNHYMVNLVARYLHSQLRSGKQVDSLNKFKSPSRRPSLVALAFKLANSLDRLNDVWPIENSGVSVFVKARKI